MAPRRLLLRGFRDAWQVARDTLGELEKAALEQLWSRSDGATVRELLPQFPGLAYTTLQTTLDRLWRKGFLDRRPRGRAHTYRTAASPLEIEEAIASRLIEGVVGAADPSALAPVMSCFVESLGERDRDLLDDLEEVVRRRRQELEERSAGEGRATRRTPGAKP